MGESDGFEVNSEKPRGGRWRPRGAEGWLQSLPQFPLTLYCSSLAL